jgi:hypothetical protein
MIETGLRNAGIARNPKTAKCGFACDRQPPKSTKACVYKIPSGILDKVSASMDSDYKKSQEEKGT